MWYTVPVVLYDKFPILGTVFESVLGDTLNQAFLYSRCPLTHETVTVKQNRTITI